MSDTTNKTNDPLKTLTPKSIIKKATLGGFLFIH